MLNVVNYGCYNKLSLTGMHILLVDFEPSTVVFGS